MLHLEMKEGSELQSQRLEVQYFNQKSQPSPKKNLYILGL
jgi:hypothetical protein